MSRTSLLALIALGLCACPSRDSVSKPDKEEVDMQPTLDHSALLDALGRQGDASVASLFASEEDYWVEPVPFDGITASRIFRGVPSDTSEPVDFLFAVDLRSGKAVLTSQNPAGVASVLFAEPAVFDKPALPKLAFELLRPRAVALTFLGDAADAPEALRAAWSPPTATRSGDGLRLAFQVLDEGRLIEWQLELTPPASGALKTRQITPGGTP